MGAFGLAALYPSFVLLWAIDWILVVMDGIVDEKNVQWPKLFAVFVMGKDKDDWITKRALNINL